MILAALLPSASSSSELSEAVGSTSRKVAGRLRAMRNEGLVAYNTNNLWGLTTEGREIAKRYAKPKEEIDLTTLPNYGEVGDRLGMIWGPDEETAKALGDPGYCRKCGARCVWQNRIHHCWIAECSVVPRPEHNSGRSVRDYEMRQYSPQNPAY